MSTERWEKIGEHGSFTYYEKEIGDFTLSVATGKSAKGGNYARITYETSFEQTIEVRGKTLEQTKAFAKQKAIKALISGLRGTADLISDNGLCGKARRHSGLLSIANQLMLF